jgi:hypothetical protein
VIYRNSAAWICCAIYVFVVAAFRYAASKEHEERWKELYMFIQNSGNQKAGDDDRPGAMIVLCDTISAFSKELWPVERLKLKVN